MTRLNVMFLALLLLTPLEAGEEELPNAPPPLGIHALTGARVVAAPGTVLEEATVLIRDGRIQGVGRDLAIPPEARRWELEGKTVYAGLIDAFTDLGMPDAGAEPRTGRRRGGASSRSSPDEAVRGPAHELPGVRADRRAADQVRVEDKTLESWRGAGFTTVATAPPSGIFRGSAALLNLGDGGARRNLVRTEIAQVLGFDRGERRQYPSSTMGVMAVLRQTLLDARHYRTAWAAYRVAPTRWRRPEANRALMPLGLVISRTRPVLVDAGGPLGLLRAGGLLEEFELDGVLVGSGQEHRHIDWLAALERPLVVPVDFPPVPAVGEDGPALDISTESLRSWHRAPDNPRLLHEAGIPFALTAHGLDRPGEMRGKVRQAIERGLDPDVALDALTRAPARLLGVGDVLGTLEPGKMANLTVTDGDLFAEKTRITAVWIDGRRYETAPGPGPEKETGEEDDKGGPKKKDRSREEDEEAADAPGPPVEIPWAPAPGPVDAPEIVLVRDATVWTQAAAGILEEGDVLIRGGVIEEVGTDVRAPSGATVVDAAGRHVTPGLIDAHSHSATAASVNEGTRAVTSEVRIEDILDPDSPTLYRLLAGGLTTANVLHGSANPIGGQNAVIKIRQGATPRGLLLEGAPPGIKFALGENVKQSNWGDDYTTRYPQTRMGVEQAIRQSFLAARDYQAAWERHRRDRGRVPPRRNLQLEALVEILEGKRLVHCHSYRQDEILMLLHLADEFGFRVATLQHVLEGYKVGPEIAARGTGASTFSDWWAYKFEVYDAIPYNGALMHEAGVVVSFNSDSSELARRMNLEAAKAVKYGGVDPERALDFVTLNPARQLGIDDQVGSLERGKDADLVIWSGDPLSTRTVAEQTWVDGKLAFDREHDVALRAAHAAERAALLEAARAAARKGKKDKQPGRSRGREEVSR